MIVDYGKMTEVELLKAVGDDGHNIQFIKNPSEAVCLIAVRQPGCAIQHIKNPSEAVCMAAVQEDKYALRYIKKPSEVMCMTAVSRGGWMIEYIKNPSEAVCLAAVISDPGAIERLTKPIPDVVAATILLHYPLYSDTPKEILNRAPEILEAHCAGLGDVYTIGISMAMTGDELSKTMLEWDESHSGVETDAEMAP